MQMLIYLTYSPDLAVQKYAFTKDLHRTMYDGVLLMKVIHNAKHFQVLLGLSIYTNSSP